MKNKNNESRSFRYMLRHLYQNRFQNRQKGSLLIGLIITIVIFSILGGAMVSIFSSSAFDAVFANYAQRAYYASESGARYMIARYRHTAPQMSISQYVALSGTVTLPNNSGQAAITITDSMPGVTANVETTVYSGITQIALAGNLKINDSNKYDKFPLKNGFFRIDAGTDYYHYKTRTGDTLYLITGPGSWPKTVIGGTTKITAPANQVSITSKGSFPLASIFNMSRSVEYGWILSGGPGSPLLPEVINLEDLVTNNPFGNKPSLGKWETPDVGGGKTLSVGKVSGSASSRVEAVIGYSGTSNPFSIAWNGAGSFLNYDAQVKIAIGTPDSGGVFNSATKPDNYVAGLTFRSTGINAGQWRAYGLSFARYRPSIGIPDTMYPNPTGIFPALTGNQSHSRGDKGENAGQNYICNAATCGVTAGILENNKWILYYPPMILLWSRGGRGMDADDWLAYKILEDEETAQSGSGVVDSNGLLKDWSTLLLRIVEAASVKLDAWPAPTSISPGDTVTAPGGVWTAKVYRAIKDSDGKLVLLLNNVSGSTGSTASVSVNGTNYNTNTSSWGDPVNGTIPATPGFRARDNYIWAMFGDTSGHGTAGISALDDTRNGNIRMTTDVISGIHWPTDNIQDWDVDHDYYKLSSWRTTNASFNPLFADMYIMGYDKEQGAILRSKLLVTNSYTSTDFPYEMGLHSIGSQAKDTYFDDLAINFQGQGGAGSPYIPPVQQ